MSIFSDNIRFLRAKRKATQQIIANELLITRERYAKYEDGRSEPPIEILLRISKFYRLSIDLLVSIDVRKYPVEDILQLPDNRIVLPVIVDSEGSNYIEIVTQKASMGYLTGYSDPEFIESLQRITLPFLTNGKYRAFPTHGDSMPPFKDGSYIIGQYVENMEDLKTNKSYIFVTINDGISYKRFKGRNKNAITVAADNPFYHPYDIPLGEIVEVWQYASGIFPEDFEPDHCENYNLQDMFLQIRKDIRNLEDKVSPSK